MDIRLVPRVLFLRAAWRSRDRWDAARIKEHQQQTLKELRDAAYEGSAFYRRHHAGLFDAPLDQLPPATKADLMENFDDAVAARGLTLGLLEDDLRSLTQGGETREYRGRDAGGRQRQPEPPGGAEPSFGNRSEWATVLASYARAYDWAGIPAGFGRPLKVALVSSLVPTHQSAVVGASLRSALVPMLRLDVTAPMHETVAALNGFQPRVLVGYASGLLPLAAEQLAGRLRVSPQGVMSASEVLTPQAAAGLEAAWGKAPFDVYAATETAGIASPCRYRNRHVYEDLLIIEPVDKAGNAVLPGTTGARILVSVLFSGTLPLIRYEMSDSISLGGRGCPCGRSFTLLENIEGRLEDVLQLPGGQGTVNIHPIVFYHVLDQAASSGWQVIQEPHGLRILLAGLATGDLHSGVRAGVEGALTAVGAAQIRLEVRVVEHVERTPLGKAPFVCAWASGRDRP